MVAGHLHSLVHIAVKSFCTMHMTVVQTASPVFSILFLSLRWFLFSLFMINFFLSDLNLYNHYQVIS
jgi:hypothetical protein